MSDDRVVRVPAELLDRLRQDMARFDHVRYSHRADPALYQTVADLLVQPVTEEPAEQQPCAGEQHRHKAWVDKYAAHVCVDCHWLIDPNGEALSSLPFEAAWIDTRASR